MGGEFGGSDAAGTYRRYVTAGLTEPPDSPWREAYQGWVLGSCGFIDRVRAMVRGQLRPERRRKARLMAGLPLERYCAVVCSVYGISPDEFRSSRESAGSASGAGLRARGQRTDGDPRRTDELARRLAAGERAEPDAAIRDLAAVRRSESAKQLSRIEEELNPVGDIGQTTVYACRRCQSTRHENLSNRDRKATFPCRGLVQARRRIGLLLPITINRELATGAGRCIDRGINDHMHVILHQHIANLAPDSGDSGHQVELAHVWAENAPRRGMRLRTWLVFPGFSNVPSFFSERRSDNIDVVV